MNRSVGLSLLSVMLGLVLGATLHPESARGQEAPAANKGQFRIQMETLFNDAPGHEILIDLDAGGGRTVVGKASLQDDFLIIDQNGIDGPVQRRYFVPFSSIQAVVLVNTGAADLKVKTFRFSPGTLLPQ